MVRKEYTFNPNKLLEKYGYLSITGGAKIQSNVLSIAKRFLPFGIKKYLKRQTSLSNIARDTLNFDGKISKAFCRTFGDWRYGIYLNDLQRFNGPVSNEQKINLTKEIQKDLNDDDLAKWLEIKLLHGASKSQEGILEFSDYGFNFRLSELQAVMGRKQLMSLDEIIKGRNETRDFYEKILSPYGFQAQVVSPSAFHNSQSVVFTVPGHIDRDHLIAKLKMQSIETTIGTYCQSNLPYFRNKY